MAGEGGLSLRPAGQPREMGQPSAPAPRGGGCSQTPLLWSANTPGDVSAALGVFGALCVPKKLPEAGPPCPRTRLP